MAYPIAHDWTLKKLLFLENYLPAFVKATKTAVHRYYVDGFAGPGYNMKKEDHSLIPGSPMLAVQHPEFTRLFFVEEDAGNFTMLQNNINASQVSQGKVRLYQGDFNYHAGSILNSIETRAPTLFFLDPFGLELKWTTLARIAEREKADVFILISGSGVLRAAAEHPDTVTEFFGDESWKSITTQKRVGESLFLAYVQAYRNRMDQLLGLTGTQLVTVAKNSKNVPLHVLAFHSKNPIALRIANSVFNNVGTNPVQPGLPFDE